MNHELVILPDARALAAAAASRVADAIRSAHAGGRPFNFAVSGGHTPWAMFAELARREVPWQDVRIFQVDERVVPEGDAQRNLTHLRTALGDAPAEVVAMRVDADDLGAAAVEYARALPARFDLVHLGLGPDGHTASLVPGDPVLSIDDQPVALTGRYQGQRRMTLTYPGLARADALLWLIVGSNKAAALKRLLSGDRSIPAAGVHAPHSVILADTEAAPDERTAGQQ